MSSPPSSAPNTESGFMSSQESHTMPLRRSRRIASGSTVSNTSNSSKGKGKEKDIDDSEIKPKEWQLEQTPFLRLPKEVVLAIFKVLNPIDAVSLSLTNKYAYLLAKGSDSTVHKPDGIVRPILQGVSMFIGAPDSEHPVIQSQGCKFCLPVLYYPPHCELNFHLRPFMPSHLNFCVSCEKYTRAENTAFSDANLHCGLCGVNYSKRFERGRRHIDMQRPGEAQLRVRKWYNINVDV
ncbi:hypothetical protein B0O99DRAFT_390645 [Bisporella sp. PMI_857]|nr:hypothetical protein B0O99DRAFT_390645 [Bisporella sp. PMI_857]